MKTTRFLVSSVVLALTLAPFLSRPAAADGTDTVDKCVKSWPEARYLGLGYNHIVHVKNVCKSTAECDVSTDVNPQPAHVVVGAASAVEVNTFMGSPARVFVPKVVCTLHS